MKRIILAALLFSSSNASAMLLKEFVTLSTKEQGMYIIGYLDTKIIDANNNGYKSYCAERWGVKGAYESIKSFYGRGPKDPNVLNFNVAFILENAFPAYCKSIEDKNGEIGPK